jgi:F0F1-type ATP synthase membrane subunit b/b'
VIRVSPSLANFLFEAANFLLLAAGLGWVLFKPVRRALESERARRASEVEEGRRLRAEAEALARQATTARETAEREVAALRRDTAVAARAEAARLLDAARTAEAAERQAFEQELAAARQAQAGALAELVGRIAAESVQALLADLDGPSLDRALVRAACAELAAAAPAAAGTALVESARPLDGDSRKLLADVLGDGFTERTVGELGAGVRVTTAAGQVDATALSLARQAARAMSAVAAAGAEPAATGAGHA